MDCLQTPLGKIMILADGNPLTYTPVLRQSYYASECYRIRIVVESYEHIACVLVANDEHVQGMVSSGEDYLCMEFIRDHMKLTIGMAVYESSAPRFSSKTIEYGLRYGDFKDIDALTFGIAWVKDHTENDTRTWYAADPTLD